METFPAAGPVKTSIIGKETPECLEAAARVQENMNYQLMDKMPEYRPEHERMLWGLGLAGNAFKKVYYDPALERQVSVFVTAEDMVVPYGASNLETAERVTHVMRKTKQELHNLQQMGFYRDIELGDPGYDQITNNSSSFNAYPTGGRRFNNSNFFNQGIESGYWSSTESTEQEGRAWQFHFYIDGIYTSLYEWYKNMGWSVRFVKD